MLCNKCGKEFKTYVRIEGELRNLGKRKFCLDCSPFNKHNTRNLVITSRCSIIWKIPTEELQAIIDSSNTMRQVLRSLGLDNKGNNYRTFLKRIKEDKLNVDKIYAFHAKRGYTPKKPNSEVFVEHSTHNRHSLKKRLVKENLLPYKCKCGNEGEWQGTKLVLQLDHINGIPDDNRLENLRFICPNCHSQTNNFAGKSHKKSKDYKDITIQGIKPEKVSKESIKKIRPSKLRDRLNKQQLEELIKQFTYTEIGRMFGVSDNAIKKFACSLGIELPNRLGYWSKVKYGKL